MHRVTCSRCGTAVQVSKNSAAQTSIQWDVDSSACPLRAELSVGDSCPALSDSIRDAVLAGELEVQTSDL
ncbi:MAG: hypothetical protein JWO12_1413 [Frankiales bacterium]|jgi:hypothetical protein|nr:hypothetical protein [Frankiales bacterium]